jgi:hypothetical protein
MRAAMLVLVAGLTLPPAGRRAEDPPKRREFVGRTQAVAAVEVRAQVAGVGLLALARTSQEFPSPDGKGVPAVGQKINAPVPQDEARAEAVKLLGSLTPLARAAAPVPKDDKADKKLRENVAAARVKAVKYLKDQQDKEGSWEGLVLGQIVGMKGGPTALATLALLEAGVPANDPVVAKAIEFLLPLEPERTYVVSLQTQVLARADAKKHAKQIQANADWLMEKAVMKDKKFQGWSYSAPAGADNSNTHFAIMGLHAAAKAGAKVDGEIWKQIRDYFADTQQMNGGWTYHNAGGANVSHSMTVVGLLGLAVAVKYDQGAKGPDPAFEKGMAFLLSGSLDQEGKNHFVVWMSVAELGRALGTTEFKSGKTAQAWYREGAEKLLKTQQEDGSLRSTGDRGGIDKDYPVITTASGLFFFGPPAKK